MTGNPAPISGKARARLMLARACRKVAELARSLVPTGTDRHATPGDYLMEARRLRTYAERVMAAAIAVEHANGTPVADLAALLALPEATVQAHLDAVTAEAEAIDLAALAAELDAWYAATGGTPDTRPDASVAPA